MPDSSSPLWTCHCWFDWGGCWFFLPSSVALVAPKSSSILFVDIIRGWNVELILLSSSVVILCETLSSIVPSVLPPSFTLLAVAGDRGCARILLSSHISSPVFPLICATASLSWFNVAIALVLVIVGALISSSIFSQPAFLHASGNVNLRANINSKYEKI
ncbi:uncharacterized protein LOC129285526 [Prosopis cineraria]|uniref:uncharacterized protein LOC129285526 n=1 Tax=Prosopis cineraria TaxID=364024 RepID=UPI00240FBE32|nr:uncharacterized protein LOC129285526 [Prosopis cineraria]